MFLTSDNPAGPDPRGNVFAMPMQATDCGCGCHKQGMGFTLSNGGGLFGTGLFSSGLDLTKWGWGELIVIGLGAYMLYSVFSTTARGARRVGRGYRYVADSGKRRRRRKADKYRAKARALEASA